MKTLPYGIRRLQEVAARIATVHALCSAFVAPLEPIAPRSNPRFGPRCIRCVGVAVFPLADTTGNPLPWNIGGFCNECKPFQRREQDAPSLGKPATLEAVETASIESLLQREAFAQSIEEMRTERRDLTRDLATMIAFKADSPFAPNGPTDEEIHAARVRLQELDEMLIFDEERPYIVGFDDLPVTYFAAQTAAQHLAVA